MGAEKVFWSLWYSQCWAQCLKLKTVHEMFLSREQEGRIDEGGRKEGNGRERGRKKKERGKEGRGRKEIKEESRRERGRKKERKRKIQVRRSGCSANPWRARQIFRKGKLSHKDSENGVRSSVSSQVLSVNEPPGKWRPLCADCTTILLQA